MGRYCIAHCRYCRRTLICAVFCSSIWTAYRSRPTSSIRTIRCSSSTERSISSNACPCAEEGRAPHRTLCKSYTITPHSARLCGGDRQRVRHRRIRFSQSRFCSISVTPARRRSAVQHVNHGRSRPIAAAAAAVLCLLLRTRQSVAVTRFVFYDNRVGTPQCIDERDMRF
jgi:hypothetical protein